MAPLAGRTLIRREITDLSFPLLGEAWPAGAPGYRYQVIAVAGATGYVGGLLCKRLIAEGCEVRAMARDAGDATDLADVGCWVVEADVLEPDTLKAALEGVDVAYYLVHSMGRGADEDFAARDHEGAANFAEAAANASLRRIVFLGGLGEGTEHLDSRNATAETLARGSVPIAYFRAAAVIGAGSESFLTVYYLVKRLPLMVTPRWVSTPTQPIAVADAVSYLAAATDLKAPLDRELQIAGPDVTSYDGMIDELAAALGRRSPPRLSIPVLSAHISSLWISLITPVDSGVAGPLVEGLATETVVTDPSGMAVLPAIERTPLSQAVREAVGEMRVG